MGPIPLRRQNQLLGALDSDVQRRLSPYLEAVRLPLGAVLHQAGEPVQLVYFPVDAIVATFCETPGCASAEISVAGNDGFVGVAALLGGESGQTRALVVQGGEAFRLPAVRLVEECSRHDVLLSLLLRYVQSRIAQVTLTAACNRHHSIEQQLCRWLLHFFDRVPGNELAMTHRLIADMLGVRREGVTAAACRLRDQGAIEYARGRIRVLDRRTLEGLSCECYAAVRNEAYRLLPQRVPEPVRRTSAFACPIA